MLAVLKSINLAVAFLLELAMLAAFLHWGFQTGETPLGKIVLGVGALLLATVVWGILMAPNAARRLQGAAYLALKIGLFGLATVALIATGNGAAGVAFGAAFALNTTLAYLWRQ